MCINVCMFVYVSVCLCLCFSLCVWWSHFLTCVSVCLSMSVYACLSMCSCICLSLFMSVSVSFSLYNCVSVCLSFSLYVSMCLCVCLYSYVFCHHCCVYALKYICRKVVDTQTHKCRESKTETQTFRES